MRLVNPAIAPDFADANLRVLGCISVYLLLSPLLVVLEGESGSIEDVDPVGVLMPTSISILVQKMCQNTT